MKSWLAVTNELRYFKQLDLEIPAPHPASHSISVRVGIKKETMIKPHVMKDALDVNSPLIKAICVLLEQRIQAVKTILKTQSPFKEFIRATL